MNAAFSWLYDKTSATACLLSIFARLIFPHEYTACAPPSTSHLFQAATIGQQLPN